MSDMEHRMEEIREALSRAVSDDALQELRVRYLGKKGEITAMMKQMRNLSPEERPAFGSKVNALRAKAEEAFAEKMAELREAALEGRLQHERIDVTLPGKSAKAGCDPSAQSGLSRSARYFRGDGLFRRGGTGGGIRPL